MTIRFDPPPRRFRAGPRGWAVGTVLAVTLVAAVVVMGRQEGESPPPASQGAVWPPAQAAHRVTVATAPAARAGATSDRRTAAGADADTTCTYQHLDLSWSNGTRQRVCVADTRASQSGSLRSLWLEGQGRAPWSLRVNTGDGRVMGASLTSPGRPEYRCGDIDGDGKADVVASGDARCRGFVIGPRDAQGARSLAVQGARLVAVARGPHDKAGRVDATAPGDPRRDLSGTEGVVAEVGLTAHLVVRSDEQDPDLACLDDRVAIVESGGAVWHLCPAGGAGVATLDDGRRIYSLTGAEGDTLVVGVDALGLVDEIELNGQRCRGHACSGATTRAGPDAIDEAGRRFWFSGTTLTGQDASGPRSSTLNGSVELPKW